MNGINIVSKAVSTKSTMPNLQCILIEASLSEIRLIANDIELGIETVIEGTITEAGKIQNLIFLELQARTSIIFLRWRKINILIFLSLP